MGIGAFMFFFPFIDFLTALRIVGAAADAAAALAKKFLEIIIYFLLGHKITSASFFGSLIRMNGLATF